MNELARRLKASRIEAGFDRPQDIAPLVGRTTRQVQHYEAGDTCPPADVLSKWAEATKKSVEYFFPQASEGVSGVNDVEKRQQHHPGLDLLAADKRIRARHRITDEEIKRAREELLTPWPIVDVETAVQAIELLRRLQPD